MSISTKTGDMGSSSLMYGRRVTKTHPRIVANGSVDELNAALGMVRAFAENGPIAATILLLQKELVVLMGELGVLEEDRERYVAGGFSCIDCFAVDRLTAQIDDLEKGHNVSYEGWATPGGTRGSAVLDVARTVCRRAERDVIALGESGSFINQESVRYLNRLSDLCWLWARWLETQANLSEPEARRR